MDPFILLLDKRVAGLRVSSKAARHVPKKTRNALIWFIEPSIRVKRRELRRFELRCLKFTCWSPFVNTAPLLSVCFATCFHLLELRSYICDVGADKLARFLVSATARGFRPCGAQVGCSANLISDHLNILIISLLVKVPDFIFHSLY